MAPELHTCLCTRSQIQLILVLVLPVPNKCLSHKQNGCHPISTMGKSIGDFWNLTRAMRLIYFCRVVTSQMGAGMT